MWIRGYQGLEERGNGNHCSVGTMFLFGVMNEFWKEMAGGWGGVVAGPCEWT